MSRRPSVLENYRVPDLTNPINPLAAHEMVSRERMHGQELEQTKQRQKAKAQEDKDKELTINPGTSGTIYDPTGLKATQDLNAEIMAYTKANPDKSIAEVKMNFAPQANKIAQYYEKAKTIKANNKVALEGLQKLGGYNLSEIDLLAQKEALIDPTTGKIRDDIDMIDVTQPYWKTAIEKNPLETTTNEGLHEYVTKAETTPSRVKVKRVDKNKGMVTDELELSVPSFIQVEKDAKGNPVISETGTYGLEPKFETLPNGTKILEEGVFKDLKNNKPSAYQRLMGEVSQFIKTNNDESDDNIALDSVEAQNIARMLAYKDIKQVWGNKGVKKYDAVVQPPAPRITINNNSGGKGGDTNPIDIYKPTYPIVKEHFDNKDNYKPIITDDGKKIYGAVPLNSLPDETANAFFNIAKGKDTKLESIGEIFLRLTDKDGIGIVRKSDNTLITTLTEREANTVANKKFGVKTVNAAKDQAGGNDKPKQKTYKIGNKEFTEEQLQKGADKNKMSLADYKKSIGL